MLLSLVAAALAGDHCLDVSEAAVRSYCQSSEEIFDLDSGAIHVRVCTTEADTYEVISIFSVEEKIIDVVESTVQCAGGTLVLRDPENSGYLLEIWQKLILDLDSEHQR